MALVPLLGEMLSEFGKAVKREEKNARKAAAATFSLADGAAQAAQASMSGAKATKIYAHELSDTIAKLGIATTRAGVAIAAVYTSAKQLAEAFVRTDDAAKMAMRGTTLMSGALTDQFRVNVDKTRRLANAYQQLSGASPEASILSMASLLDSMNKVNIEPSVKEMDRYTATMAASARVSNMSAEESGSLQDKLLRGLNMGLEESIGINGAVIAATKNFGLTGGKSIQVITDNMSSLQALDMEDRDDMAMKMLHAAGIYEKAGRTFGEYTKSLTNVEGGTAMEKASMVSSLANAAGEDVTYKDVLRLQNLADHHDLEAEKELIRLIQVGVDKVTGIDMAKRQQDMATGIDSATNQALTPEDYAKGTIGQDIVMQAIGKTGAEYAAMVQNQKLINKTRKPDEDVDFKADANKALSDAAEAAKSIWGDTKTAEEMKNAINAAMLEPLQVADKYAESLKNATTAINTLTPVIASLSLVIGSIAALFGGNALKKWGTKKAAEFFGRRAANVRPSVPSGPTNPAYGGTPKSTGGTPKGGGVPKPAPHTPKGIGRRVGRGVGGVVGGLALDAVSEYAADSLEGYSGEWTNNAGNIASATVTGASIGGLPGAVVGAVVGSAKGVYDAYQDLKEVKKQTEIDTNAQQSKWDDAATMMRTVSTSLGKDKLQGVQARFARHAIKEGHDQAWIEKNMPSIDTNFNDLFEDGQLKEKTGRLTRNTPTPATIAEEREVPRDQINTVKTNEDMVSTNMNAARTMSRVENLMRELVDMTRIASGGKIGMPA